MDAENPTTASTPTGEWRSIPLTDVRTGEEFTVDQFAGQPILLESFAVWCPVCTAQQRSIASLLDRRDDVVAISLNTDPNEDADAVRKHVEKQGFGWRYTVAPSSMTERLIDAFGFIITNAPSAPVVRICPDGEAALVRGGGAKSAATLADAIDEC